MSKALVLVLGVLLLIAVLLASPVLAESGLLRTTWPSAEDPGPPFYVRIEPYAPPVYDDGVWAVFVFYRDPGCIPGSFNLLNFFDAPAAFGCPLTVQGSSLWQGAPFNGAPKIGLTTGNGATPVWFAPVASVEQALQDGNLTIGELAGLDGLLVGYAEQLNEVLHPHPLPPELGGGGHPNPKLVLNANGALTDGRQFQVHITRVRDELQTIQIQIQ